jgi:hypothetical protein
MRLSQSQDQNCGFDRLNRVKSAYFCIFFFSIRLFQSDDPGHQFGGLTQVALYVFLIDFFSNRILQYWTD